MGPPRTSLREIHRRRRLLATQGEVWATRTYDSTAMPDEPTPLPADLVSRLPERWAQLATGICGTLARAGHRGWIVGGAVRDLLLDRDIKDVDLVSAALPEEVEGLFERTVAVGKSFGIIVVVMDGAEVELATFRRERGYSDRRRPDEVEYAAAPEEDAGRRDFTCNAIYLDPLTGELRDPVGGLADLRAGVLRAVGDPGGRFREDGLRILRMARFHAALELEPAPGLLAAAEAERASLAGVSAERVREELQKMLRGARAHRALQVLVNGGHAAAVLPSMGRDAAVASRLRVLAALGALWDQEPRAVVDSNKAAGDEPTASWRWELGLSALFGPLERVIEGAEQAEPAAALVPSLEALRCSREERRVVTELSIGCEALRSLAAKPRPGGLSDVALPVGAEARGGLIQLWRRPTRAASAQLAQALEATLSGEAAGRRLESILGLLSELESEAPLVPVTLSAGDLQDLGVPRGPLLGALLGRVQRASLGGAFEDRPGALAWVEGQVR